MSDYDVPAPRRPGYDLASVAIDHVRLSYQYLDEGDMDAYCSLFAEQAVLRRPGARPVTGRAELERIGSPGAGRVRHLLYEVFGSGRRVAAIGRQCFSPAGEHDAGVDFVDVFTVADNGLLTGRTTFLFAPAAGGHADHGTDANPPR